MEKTRMLEMEETVVVGGTEGGRSPTGVSRPNNAPRRECGRDQETNDC